MSTTEPGVHAPTTHSDDGPRRPWTVLVLALTAQILVVLDISVVNTALPTIGRALDLSSSDLQWMVTAYLLMSGGGLLLGGRIADLLPRHRVFMTGMLVFTTASLVSGFASSATEIVLARGAQGVGAALMTPAALSLIMTTYSGAQRAKALALWGAVGGLGIAAGVVVGGALTTWAGWQSVFWLNVPIGIVSLAIASNVLPRQTTTPALLATFDLAGAATAVGGLATLMFALAGAPSHGWTSARTITALAISAVLLGGFGFVERRVSQPLVHPHTWKLRSLVSGTVVMLGVTGLLVAAVFLGSIFVQTVLGYSALQSGLAFLPLAVVLIVGTHVAARLSAHATARTIAVIGLLVATAGTVLLSRVSAGDSYAADVLPGLVVVGFGAGMVFVAVSASAMTGIPAQHSGLASGFLMTGHEIGAALGVAVLSAVATTAGALTTVDGASVAVGRGFAGAAVWTLLFAAFALVRMPATRSDGAVHMHH